MTIAGMIMIIFVDKTMLKRRSYNLIFVKLNARIRDEKQKKFIEITREIHRGAHTLNVLLNI